MENAIQNLLRTLPTFQGQNVAVHPLVGGLTNRNYRLDTATESFVLRIGGADTALLGIDRQCELACSQLAFAAAVGPEIVAHLPEHSTLIRRFVHGRLLTEEDAKQPEILRRLAHTLKKYHAHPTPSNLGVFSPFATVRNYCTLARERNVPLPDDLDHALEILLRVEESLKTNEPICLCHNDLLPSNFLDDGVALRLIDWEYAALGDRFFDLGNLAVNFQLDADQEEQFLADYFGQTNPDLLRRLRLMRLASDMREATWGYLQAGISQLHSPTYYLDYARKHLNRFLSGTTGVPPVGSTGVSPVPPL